MHILHRKAPAERGDSANHCTTELPLNKLFKSVQRTKTKPRTIIFSVSFGDWRDDLKNKRYQIIML